MVQIKETKLRKKNISQVMAFNYNDKLLKYMLQMAPQVINSVIVEYYFHVMHVKEGRKKACDRKYSLQRVCCLICQGKNIT